jgi:hypothetical protein
MTRVEMEEMEALIVKNPRARRHADSIRETLKTIQELRDKGMAGSGYTLSNPRKGIGAFGRLPEASRQRRRIRTKRTEDA